MQRRRQPPKQRLPVCIRRGVSRRVCAQSAWPVGSEREMLTIGCESGARQIRRRELEPMPLECELARETWGQQVRTGGDLEAWREFARHRGTAYLGGGLQHEHLAATTGEIRGAHETVVAATNHDAVVARAAACTHESVPSAGPRPRSCRIACAQLAPGAPMTPPPG